MQTKGKVFEDFAQLLTNAMGVAQDARQEVETAVSGWFDRWIAERDLVTREEFDAVRLMAERAREENEALLQRIEALESAAGKAGGGKKPGPAKARKPRGPRGAPAASVE